MSNRTKNFSAAASLANGKTTTTLLLSLLQPIRKVNSSIVLLDYPQERGICLYNPYIPINHFAVEPKAQTQLAQDSDADFQLNIVDSDASQDNDYVLVEEENIDDDYELIDTISLRM